MFDRFYLTWYNFNHIMLQELRNEILIAEGQASDILAKAKEDAKDILYKCELEIIERRTAFLDNLNKGFQQEIAAAKKSAASSIANSKELAKASVDSVVKTASKNLASAVKLIVDNILN